MQSAAAPVQLALQRACWLALHVTLVSVFGVHAQPVGTVAGFAQPFAARKAVIASAAVWGRHPARAREQPANPSKTATFQPHIAAKSVAKKEEADEGPSGTS
jgi:hypothetical protein